ncbi:MAG: hypothetical protein KAV87_21885 [Desulfobacteraceae bacterium]|nr:hypothetical protein [Desulfobacteraceae bacterium]
MENADTSKEINYLGDEYWEWFVTALVPPYEITVKYLFFSAACARSCQR